jgi:putative membrane protein
MRFLLVFLLRWIINSFGLWLAVRLFGTGYAVSDIAAGTSVFLVAGFVFSIVNSLLRPVVAFLSFPLIIVTLGLFTLVINGLMVYLSLKLTPGISMTFGHAILAGIVIGLVNYAMNSIINTKHAIE